MAMIAVILATGLLASGGQSSVDSLRLELSAPAEIIVGEPTKLRTTWTALRDVEVIPTKLQVWLDRGTGFRPYHELRHGIDGLLARDRQGWSVARHRAGARSGGLRGGA